MRSDATYFKELKFNNFHNIGDFDISCEKYDGSVNQWTVLLGNNNTGKTSILKAIADLSPVKMGSVYIPVVFRNSSFELQSFLSQNSIKSSSSLFKENKVDRHWEIYSNLWGYFKGAFTGSTDRPNFDIYAYGVSRYPATTNLTESIGEPCESLYNPSARLINIEEWIMQMRVAISDGNNDIKRKFDIFHSVVCDGKLFPEIYDFKTENDGFQSKVLFKTDDGWFKYNELGFGYQSMLSWVADFCFRMFMKYPISENPLAEPAIVLLDEIDLNLHPEWQRRVVGFLTKKFPNTQFIATTHSPFVVQSMESVNLYVLNREGKDVTISRVPGHDFRGWSVESILENIMGLRENINSDEYNRLFKMFDNGLDTDNKELVEDAYRKLSELLPINSKARKVLDIQYNSFMTND